MINWRCAERRRGVNNAAHTFCLFQFSLTHSLTVEWWPWAILLFIGWQRWADCLSFSYLYGTQTSSGMPVALLSVLTVVSIAVLNQPRLHVCLERKVPPSCLSGVTLKYILELFLINFLFCSDCEGNTKYLTYIQKLHGLLSAAFQNYCLQSYKRISEPIIMLGPEVGQSQGPFKKHLFSSLIVLLNAKKSMSLKDFTLQNFKFM